MTGSIPSGVIVIWNGASTAIPTGWVLCNGSNGTPDLRDRFIVGAGSTYTVGNTGGEATHTLNISELPAHNHTATLSMSGLTCSSSGAHTHNVTTNGQYRQGFSTDSDTIGGNGGMVNPYMYLESRYATYWIAESAGGHTHTISGSGSVSLDNTGSSTAHENRPPYYALCYIMKI